jgi:hypothetical protein
VATVSQRGWSRNDRKAVRESDGWRRKRRNERKRGVEYQEKEKREEKRMKLTSARGSTGEIQQMD